jgi:hypothetical protein
VLFLCFDCRPSVCCVPNVAQHSKQKGKSITENPETQATLSTRRNEDKQNKNTIQKTEVAINNIQFFGLFIIDCPFCLLCCSFALIVVLLCVVCPMLPLSLDSLLMTLLSLKWQSIINNREIQATLGTQDTEGRQSKQRNNTANRRDSQ